MKRLRKRNTIATMIWKSYVCMVLISIVMIIVPYLICIFVSERLNQIEEYQNCSAADIMQDDYYQIDVSKIRNLRGSVQVVTENLEVITLCGEGVISQNVLNAAQWTNFLIKSGGVHEIECDILYNEKGKFWLIVELPVVAIQFRFVANKDLVEYHRIVVMIWTMLVSYILLVLLSAVCYSRMVATDFKKPFHKLCDFVKKLEHGVYHQRMELEGTVEFRDLEQGINHLAQELEKEKNFRQQVENSRNQLIRDISHDLKNPLMAIRGYAEFCMEKDQLTQQQWRDYLELILQNSIRANELLMGLFDYAKLESADFVLQKEEVDICEFLRQELIVWIPELDARHFTYEANIPESSMLLQIDVAQMKRVFANLFINAMKYNPERTEILLTLKKVEKSYEIIFADNGVGMDEQYAKNIFEPFSRPDNKVRNSQAGGSGLGLAIVKKIILLHNGDIFVETKQKEGTKFKIIFPI